MALDIVTQIDTLKKYKKAFILSPDQWRALSVGNLSWENVKFEEGNKSSVPKTRGVYCFVIKHVSDALPSNGYIAYIGLVGDSNDRTLQVRYGDYLRDQRRPKRYHIHEMLNKWKDDIYFYYARVPDRRRSLARIETRLLDAVIPPFNKSDFTGDFGRIVREAWL